MKAWRRAFAGIARHGSAAAKPLRSLGFRQKAYYPMARSKARPGRFRPAGAAPAGCDEELLGRVGKEAGGYFAYGLYDDCIYQEGLKKMKAQCGALQKAVAKLQYEADLQQTRAESAGIAEEADLSADYGHASSKKDQELKRLRQQLEAMWPAMWSLSFAA